MYGGNGTCPQIVEGPEVRRESRLMDQYVSYRAVRQLVLEASELLTEHRCGQETGQALLHAHLPKQ